MYVTQLLIESISGIKLKIKMSVKCQRDCRTLIFYLAKTGKPHSLNSYEQLRSLLHLYARINGFNAEVRDLGRVDVPGLFHKDHT